MRRFPEHHGHAITVVAECGKRFSDFAPYVASINDAGVVAFQAALTDGGSGVYCGAGGPLNAVCESTSAGSPITEVISHPDINDDDACCFYALGRDGAHGVYLKRGSVLARVAEQSGPLGPTVNSSAIVGCRVEPTDDEEWILACTESSKTVVARTGPSIRAFHGLPVVNRNGMVALRAELPDERGAILVGDGRGPLRTVASTGDRFTALGFFPIHNDAGEVAFAAMQRDGTSGIFVAQPGDEIETVIDSADGRFESFRGVLIDNAGRVVFYATPRGGAIGVYVGPDERRDRLLSLGGELLGSTVIDFAQNPVSINDRRQIAVRVKLADGRHYIVRIDLDGAENGAATALSSAH